MGLKPICCRFKFWVSKKKKKKVFQFNKFGPLGPCHFQSPKLVTQAHLVESGLKKKIIIIKKKKKKIFWPLSLSPPLMAQVFLWPSPL